MSYRATTSRTELLTIVGVAVGVVHSDGLLALQDPSLMSHHTRLVQRRLTVKDKDIAVP
jgi:hypothetical protein